MTATMSERKGPAEDLNEDPSPSKKDNKAKGDKKGGGFKKVVILLVVLALVGFVAKGKLVKPHYSAKHEPPPGEVLALDDASGDASLTTSLADDHLVQVSIALQLTKAASSKAITDEIPQFLNVATSVMAGETYTMLLTPAGQASAKAAILHGVQQVAGLSDGGEQISAVYFEGLIVQ